MRAVALGLGLGGAVFLIAPDNALGWLGNPSPPVTVVLTQLYGAALLGLASGAWIARDMLLGGIFGHAVVVSNGAHGLVGALVLTRAVASAPTALALWAGLAAYVVLADGFGALLFGPTP